MDQDWSFLIVSSSSARMWPNASAHRDRQTHLYFEFSVYILFPCQTRRQYRNSTWSRARVCIGIREDQLLIHVCRLSVRRKTPPVLCDQLLPNWNTGGLEPCKAQSSAVIVNPVVLRSRHYPHFWTPPHPKIQIFTIVYTKMKLFEYRQCHTRISFPASSGIYMPLLASKQRVLLHGANPHLHSATSKQNKMDTEIRTPPNAFRPPPTYETPVKRPCSLPLLFYIEMYYRRLFCLRRCLRTVHHRILIARVEWPLGTISHSWCVNILTKRIARNYCAKYNAIYSREIHLISNAYRSAVKLALSHRGTI